MKRRRGSDQHATADRSPVGGPSDSGAAAARARLEVLLERLTRVELQVVVVAPPDATRLAARDRARAAAIGAGRGALLEAAMAAAREVAFRAFARAGFSGTWAATDMAVSVATAGDRVAAAAALEEAALAAVVEDLVDQDTLEVLRSTSNELAGLSGVPSPGSLSALGSAAITTRNPLQVTIVAAFVILLAVVGLAVGSTTGLAALALAVAIVAGAARRLSPPGP